MNRGCSPWPRCSRALTGLGFVVVPDCARVVARARRPLVRRSSARKHRSRAALWSPIQVAASSCCGFVRALIPLMLRVQPPIPVPGLMRVPLRTVLPSGENSDAEARAVFYATFCRCQAPRRCLRARRHSGVPMVFTGWIARVVLPGQEVRRDGDFRVSPGMPAAVFSTISPLLRARSEDTDTV